MAYTFEFNKDIAYAKFTDNVTTEELFNASHELSNNYNFDTLKYQILDFSNTIKIDIDSENMLILAEHRKASSLTNKFTKIIYIANDNDILELIEKYISLMSDISNKVILINHIRELDEIIFKN